MGGLVKVFCFKKKRKNKTKQKRNNDNKNKKAKTTNQNETTAKQSRNKPTSTKDDGVRSEALALKPDDSCWSTGRQQSPTISVRPGTPCVGGQVVSSPISVLGHRVLEARSSAESHFHPSWDTLCLEGRSSAESHFHPSWDTVCWRAGRQQSPISIRPGTPCVGGQVVSRVPFPSVLGHRVLEGRSSAESHFHPSWDTVCWRAGR